MSAIGVESLEDVLVAVIEAQRPGLRGFFVRGSGEKTFAEDLLQETALRVWAHRESLSPDSAEDDVREGVRRYVWRVARNLMLDEFRFRRRQRVRIGMLAGSGDDEAVAVRSIHSPAPADPEQAIERKDCLRIIRAAVDHLDNERVRHCLQLWLEGVDVKQIASQHNQTAGQVRGLLQRGRAEITRQASERFGAFRVVRTPRAERQGMDTASALSIWPLPSRTRAAAALSAPPS